MYFYKDCCILRVNLKVIITIPTIFILLFYFLVFLFFAIILMSLRIVKAKHSAEAGPPTLTTRSHKGTTFGIHTVPSPIITFPHRQKEGETKTEKGQNE